MVCLAIFLLREALHEVELSSTFRNGLQQLTIPFHSVSPPSNLSRNFTAVLTRAHAHTSCFSFRGHIARQVAEKIAQCNSAFTRYEMSTRYEALLFKFY